MVRRIPIKIQRTPIKLPDNIKPQLALWELTEQTKEEDILELAEHFNMLMMEVTNKAGYTTLPYKNPTEHKNWIHFESVYEICRMKGWDRKLYVEAQFKRARTWKRANYPLPNMLYSDNAIRYFIRYYGDLVIKHSKDTDKDKRKKGKETKSLSTLMVEGIIDSAQKVSDSISRHRNIERGQQKALYIFNNWSQLSPFYLYTIPWFHDILGDLEATRVEKCVKEFDRISKSPMMQRTINETVQQADTHFNLPENIKF